MNRAIVVVAILWVSTCLYMCATRSEQCVDGHGEFSGGGC